MKWRTASQQTWPASSTSSQFFIQSFPPASLREARSQNQIFINHNIHNFANPFYPGAVTYNQLPVFQPAFVVPTPKPEKPVTATKKPAKKRKQSKAPEPTTKAPQTKKSAKRPLSESDKLLQEDSNLQLLASLQYPVSNFIIDRVIPVPGTRLFQTVSVEKNQPERRTRGPTNQLSNEEEREFKIESISKTAADKPVPYIPFGAYFAPYFSTVRAGDSPSKIASLILEPQSKAVVGNGGTAISAPVSRAIIKKGVPTNVYYHPESVAIAGAGGKAHAQADLVIDMISRR